MGDISTWSPVDESNTMAPPDGWPEGQATNTVNNCARGMMGAVRRFYDTINTQISNITTSLAGYLPLSGGAITGNLTVAGSISGATVSVAGVNAAYSFADRTGGGSWLWYSTGNIARLWMSGDRVTVDTGGNIVAGGNINGQTITGSQITSSGNINAAGSVSAGTVSAGTISASGQINASVYTCDGNTVLDTGGGATILYKDGNVSGIELYNAATYYTNNDNIFRNSAAAITCTIGPAGNVNATGQVQGASLYSRGRIDAAGIVAAVGDVTTSGVFSGARLQGGPGGAGQLRTWNTVNSVNFVWDTAGTGQLSYRVDESVQKLIGATVNVLDTQYAYPGGGPTNAVMGGHDFPGTWYYSFIDYTSDERIKSNIAPTQVDALSILKQVPVDEFDIRPEVVNTFRSLRGIHGREVASSDHIPIGLVAQKLQALIPEAVYVGPQPGDNPLPEDCHNITLPAITPYLIRAVQQLAARLEALEGAGERELV